MEGNGSIPAFLLALLSTGWESARPEKYMTVTGLFSIQSALAFRHA